MSNGNEFSGQEIYDSLKKKLKWLDKDPRAAYFYFFYIARYLSELRANNVQSQHPPQHSPQLNPLSAESLGMEPIELSIEKNTTATLAGMTSQVNLEELGENDIDKILERMLDPRLFPSSENAELGYLEVKPDVTQKLVLPEHNYANGVYSYFLTKIATGVENIFEGILRGFLCLGAQTRRELIKEINTSWSQAYHDFPEAFSWMDINDKKQCLWAWKAMEKKFVTPPVNPLNNYQRWHFICATFDLWGGWTNEQLIYLKESRKKISQKFSNLQETNHAPQKHKVVLMDELEKAWGQKTFRRKTKENDAVIKLPASTKKNLIRLSENYGVPALNMVISLIEREYTEVISDDSVRKKQ